MRHADPHQLELALLNLAMNARDAMPKGGAIVIGARERTMTAEPGLKPGQYLCVTVTDTGTGMNDETLKRATEPFFTTKGVGKGTGLGLPMVHGMAQQSGGKLALRSKPDFGTTAELYLRVAQPDAAFVQEETIVRAPVFAWKKTRDPDRGRRSPCRAQYVIAAGRTRPQGLQHFVRNGGA